MQKKTTEDNTNSAADLRERFESIRVAIRSASSAADVHSQIGSIMTLAADCEEREEGVRSQLANALLDVDGGRLVQLKADRNALGELSRDLDDLLEAAKARRHELETNESLKRAKSIAEEVEKAVQRQFAIVAELGPALAQVVELAPEYTELLHKVSNLNNELRGTGFNELCVRSASHRFSGATPDGIVVAPDTCINVQNARRLIDCAAAIKAGRVT